MGKGKSRVDLLNIFGNHVTEYYISFIPIHLCYMIFRGRHSKATYDFFPNECKIVNEPNLALCLLRILVLGIKIELELVKVYSRGMTLSI